VEEQQREPQPLVDVHCHLAWPGLREDVDLVARARAAGVYRMLATATNLEDATQVLQIARAHPQVFAAIGIHPNDVLETDDFSRLETLLAQPKVVAVGETGLDYYRDHTAPVLQRQSLDRHFALAAQYRLPIVLHNREADADILAAIAAAAGTVTGILHCFSSSLQVAETALAHGFYLSFAGNLTYPSATSLREVAAWAPADRLLSETDAPFLAPVPFRSKRNEPAHVRHTVEALARCRSMPVADLAAQVASNARTLVGW
jgi:TatD DNase family protein